MILWRRAIRIRGATTTPCCAPLTEPPAFYTAPALCLLLVGRRRGGAALCCCATNIQLGPASSINIRSSLNKAHLYPNCCAVYSALASLFTGDPAHSSRSVILQPTFGQSTPPPPSLKAGSAAATLQPAHTGGSAVLLWRQFTTNFGRAANNNKLSFSRQKPTFRECTYVPF